MTIHPPRQRRTAERLLVAASHSLSAAFAVAYVAYLALRTVGGNW